MGNSMCGVEIKCRRIGLDIFRIASAIAVCAFHTTAHLNADYGVFQPIVRMGAVFMTAFFVLSGYALFINYSSKDISKLDQLKIFWIKRIINIIPLYYIVAIIYTVINSREGTMIDEFVLLPIELLGIQSGFSSLEGYSHNKGTWFVSCILMCYFIYPWLQCLIKQISNKWKIVLMVLCSFVLLYSPLIVNRFGLFSTYSNWFFRTIEFFMGVILASLEPEVEKSKFIKKYLYKWPTILLINAIMIGGGLL